MSDASRSDDLNQSAPAGLVFDDRYLWHNTGISLIDDQFPYPFSDPVAHVSSPALVGRAKHLMDLYGVTDRMLRIPAYEADDEALGAVHTTEYIARVTSLSKTGGDTGEGAPIGVGGDRIARLAAGGVMAAVDAVIDGPVGRAYALVRPPGHHAMPNLGMGFCVYGNVAIAARHAQRHHGVGKILILDWDVHHGNGTQTVFCDDPGVLFVSIHQDDLFPSGWGAVNQVGEGLGEGFTVNIPLPAGTGRAGYLAAFEQIVLPIGREFSPDFIFISAGQDASVFDPLARMSLTTDDYREMARMMLDLAEQTCGGRLVVAQEGGYAATYAPYCSATIAEALSLAESPLIPEPYGERASTQPAARELGLDAGRALQIAATVQRRYWAI